MHSVIIEKQTREARSTLRTCFQQICVKLDVEYIEPIPRQSKDGPHDLLHELKAIAAMATAVNDKVSSVKVDPPNSKVPSVDADQVSNEVPGKKSK